MEEILKLAAKEEEEEGLQFSYNDARKIFVWTGINIGVVELKVGEFVGQGAGGFITLSESRLPRSRHRWPRWGRTGGKIRPCACAFGYPTET